MSSHKRALVSNAGDGNWGDGTENLIDSANHDIYFPPGAAKGTIPATAGANPSGLGPFSETDFVGWATKSNWMVQISVANLGTSGGTPTVNVYAVRPTGLQELVLSVTTTGIHEYGGFGAEKIAGPVSFFRFQSVSTGGTPLILCYVMGWNEGDIAYGFV